jgi:hypothetical protein
MSTLRPYDISIGKDEWISYVAVGGRLDEAVNIDALLAPMESFWTKLETNSLTGCCGIDAFDLWPEEIQRASKQVADHLLPQKLHALRAFVVASDNSDFISMRLNHRFHRSVLLQVLDHVARHITTDTKS